MFQSLIKLELLTIYSIIVFINLALSETPDSVSRITLTGTRTV